MISTHSQKLERWLGPEHVATLSNAMTSWYGPAIAVAGVPGNVWAVKGGDFAGRIEAGQFASALDFAESRLSRIGREFARRQQATCHTGFSSLSDLISEASAGKSQMLNFSKLGATKVISAAASLWSQGPSPSAGVAGSTAAGGTVYTSTDAGALYFANPTTTTDSVHFIGATVVANYINTLLMYDRLFAVAKSLPSSSGTAQAVTGVPTRYTSATSGAADWAGGNFLYVASTTTALSATAHTWGDANTTYTNQAGTAGKALPAMTGVSSCIVQRLDQPVATWYAPLAAGDVGITSLQAMCASSSGLTGACEFVIGHPIAWLPVPMANMGCMIDGINTAFSLTRIFQSAALAFLEVAPPAVTATTYAGSVTICAG